MPINVPNDLPAISQLEKENIFVMGEERSTHQDIRPLDILLVNLMPTKVETEIQLMRLLSNTPLQVNVRLVQMKTHVSKSVSQKYLDQFYDLFDEVNVCLFFFHGKHLLHRESFLCDVDIGRRRRLFNLIIQISPPKVNISTNKVCRNKGKTGGFLPDKSTEK